MSFSMRAYARRARVRTREGQTLLKNGLGSLDVDQTAGAISPGGPRTHWKAPPWHAHPRSKPSRCRFASGGCCPKARPGWEPVGARLEGSKPQLMQVNDARGEPRENKVF